MTMWQRMRSISSRAKELLGKDSSQLVSHFIQSKISPSGAYVDRAGNPDLYYCVFGLECSNALNTPVPEQKLKNWLSTHGAGENLDLIHLSSLIHSTDQLFKQNIPEKLRKNLSRQILKYKSCDGTYSTQPEQKHGSAYACFMALNSCGNLKLPVQTSAFIDRIYDVATPDGGFALHSGIKQATTPTTAAAIATLHELNTPLPKEARDWLWQRFDGKGFRAVPLAPFPDLLSTATALNALSMYGETFTSIRENCLDFIDTLWVNKGGFHGTWEDEHLDLEYTFYALLALGHLAE